METFCQRIDGLFFIYVTRNIFEILKLTKGDSILILHNTHIREFD